MGTESEEAYYKKVFDIQFHCIDPGNGDWKLLKPRPTVMICHCFIVLTQVIV